ncbi:MAG: PQQ-binding-like beta-propeller repeat protein, partial [Bacteroidetes bacterium]|nr:PQQ-binding-like beta-propeller repeat protein [Bacteroidota bacterium]
NIACVLTGKGIYAIDRIKYLAIKEKLEHIREQRNEQGGNFYKYSNTIFSHVTHRAGPMYNGYVDIDQQELDEQFDELTQLLFKLDKEEEELKATASKWEYYREDLNVLIFAGDQVFAGGDDKVVALNAQTGEELWQEKTEGKTLGLAVSDGCLIVSTDKGTIYCFGEKQPSKTETVIPNIIDNPYSSGKSASIYENAAENILSETVINKGYCLVLDCGEGQLVYELAKHSDMQIIGIEKDQAKIKTARENLDAAGLYGSRVIVEDWDISDLPDYFANLIVSGKLIISGEISSSFEEMFRVLKPCGGIICLGQPEKTTNKIPEEELVEWLKSSNAPEPEITTENGLWAKVIRGKLKDSGSWATLYGNSANTGCSDDKLVKAPFRTLWFGKPGPEKMVERHAKAMSPVAKDGRMFIQGENIIMAYDSYNGVLLWEKEIPGAFRVYANVDGGNMAITENSLFVAAYDKCYQLDPKSGETLHMYNIPGNTIDKPRRWAFVTSIGNTLFGSAAKPFDQDYNQVWKNMVRDDGTWKNSGEVDPAYAAALDFYKAKCPSPGNMALTDFQRGSIKWAYMTEFPLWDGSRMRPNEGPDNRLMFSDAVFAINIKTGETKWIFRGKKIAHHTISIENGNIFFADATVTNVQKEKAIRERQSLIKQGRWEGYKDKVAPEDIDVRSIIALDASTGEIQWQKAVDLSGCGGNATASAHKNDILLFFGSYGLHDKWRYADGQIEWRRITALSAKNGKFIWSRPLNYMVRPVIVGDEIIIEPRACDLYTGDIKMRTHPITGKQVTWEFLRPNHGCNNISASPNCLFYRSDVSAFYDLEKDRGINYYGGIRPGCWINMIPANGLLLYPEASSGCTCSYPIKST